MTFQLGLIMDSRSLTRMLRIMEGKFKVRRISNKVQLSHSMNRMETNSITITTLIFLISVKTQALLSQCQKSKKKSNPSLSNRIKLKISMISLEEVSLQAALSLNRRALSTSSSKTKFSLVSLLRKSQTLRRLMIFSALIALLPP